MRRLISFLCLLPSLIQAQLYVPENALVHIAKGANLEVGGDLENNGAIQNLGTLSLYRNWFINNSYNGLAGTLQFLGGDEQEVNLPRLVLNELVINKGDKVNFSGDEYLVLDKLDLQFGNIASGENTRFILSQDAKVIGGSDLSYFDGTLIAKGSGNRMFPLGSAGVYAPVTLLNVFGVNTEIAASFQKENETDPVPGDSLLGVSHRGLWAVEVLKGDTDPVKVELTFTNEDLSDFKIQNNIRHRVNSPVITYADSPSGVFQSLGVASLNDTDSLTYGTIQSERAFQPVSDGKIFLSVGLAPRIPDEGLYFIPEAFSPQASDPKNQTFRIFGNQISEEGFNLQIYNRYGSVVYTTDSFSEANENGWNGKNQRTGAEEPPGVYYYTIKFAFQTGLPVEQKGALYLVK